jgi:hypothetical protein
MTGALWFERLDVEPMTANVAITARAYHARRREIRSWREWAADAAAMHDPITVPVTITVVHLRVKATRIDCGAPFFAAKGAVDGLVDARVLRDDSTKWVRSLTFATPEVVGRHGLRLIVHPIEQHTTKPQPTPTSDPIPLLAEPIPGGSPK